METEKEPLLEVVPSQEDLDKGEALGTGGVVGIEVAPSKDSLDLICKRAALGTGERVSVAIMEGPS